MKYIFMVFLSLTFAIQSQAQEQIHTENNEWVCQFENLLGTKLFVDTDTELDDQVGAFNTKVIEMPTRNAAGNNFRLFPTKLLKVKRSEKNDSKQEILFSFQDSEDVINKLEVIATHAVLTSNVDAHGIPLDPHFVDEGDCSLNEVP